MKNQGKENLKEKKQQEKMKMNLQEEKNSIYSATKKVKMEEENNGFDQIEILSKISNGQFFSHFPISNKKVNNNKGLSIERILYLRKLGKNFFFAFAALFLEVILKKENLDFC